MVDTTIAQSSAQSGAQSDGTVGSQDFLSRYLRKDDGVIAFVAIVMIVMASIALNIAGSKATPYNSGLANLLFYYTKFALILIAHYTWILCVDRPESPFRHIYQSDKIRALKPRIFSTLILLTSVGLFMPAFTAVKSAIPLFNAFTWDQTFIDWDRALHGDDAWRVIQPVFGQPAITSILSYFYHAWFLLIFFGPACVAMYVQNRELRFRFFLGYILTWTIIGMICAVAFASVGPVFLEPILGDDHFNEQMAYLNSAGETHSVLVLEVQNMLLNWYRAGEYGLGRGITAMPSMHVALCMLYFMAMRELDKRLGWAFLAFLIIIMIGSVHLAYHYAVDGYVSIVLTAMIWWATKPIAKWMLKGSSSVRSWSEKKA